MAVVRFNSFAYTPKSGTSPYFSPPFPVVAAFGVHQEAFEYTGSGDDTTVAAYLSRSHTQQVWNEETEEYDTVVVPDRVATVDVVGATTQLNVQDYASGEPDGAPVQFELTTDCLVFNNWDGHLVFGVQGDVGVLASDPDGVWRCDEYGRPFDVDDLQA